MKPKLRRSLLAAHRIIFEEQIDIDKPLEGVPQHAEFLRDALLDFDELFEPNCEPTLLSTHKTETRRYDNSLYPPPSQSCYLQPTDERPNRMLEGRSIIMENDLCKISRQADTFYDLERRKCDEDDWTYELRRLVFINFDISPYRGKDYSRYGYLFDHWSCVFNYRWTGAINRNLEPLESDPSKPQPDITFGFTMIEDEPHTSKGLWKDHSATNFHTTILSKLLSTYHRTSLPKLGKHGNANNDLLCFPWAVVEIKQADKSLAEDCYCQAANACSFALQLFDDLVFQATGRRDHTIPLVVAFTFVGAEYTVWLAYLAPADSGKNYFKMKCIWRHSIATTWGFIALREIVMNMHIWASRVLRPQISGFISLCRTKNQLEKSQPRNNVSSPGTPVSMVVSPRADAKDTFTPVFSTRNPEAPKTPLSYFSSGLWPFPGIEQTNPAAKATNLSSPSYQFQQLLEPNVSKSQFSFTTTDKEAKKRSSLAQAAYVTSERHYLMPRRRPKAGGRTEPLAKIPVVAAQHPSDGPSVQTSEIPTSPRPGESSASRPAITIGPSKPLSTLNTDGPLDIYRNLPDFSTIFPMKSTITEDSLRLENTQVKSNPAKPIEPIRYQPPGRFDYETGQRIRPKSSSSLLPPDFQSNTQVESRPRSSSFLNILNASQRKAKSNIQRGGGQDEGPSDLNGQVLANTETSPDIYHYHRYQLSDQSTRWDKSFTPLLGFSEDTEEQSGDASDDVGNDDGMDSLFSPEKHQCKEVHCGAPQLEDIQNWQEKALMLLTGREFLQLKGIKARIDSMSGQTLLDTVIRTLRELGDYDWRSLKVVEPIFNELNYLLMRTGDDMLQFADIKRAGTMDLLRSELERVQIVRDHTGDELRVLLRKCLLLLESEMCFAMLQLTPQSSSPGMPTEELAEMKEQAVLIMLHDWTGQLLEDGYMKETDEFYDTDEEVDEEVDEEDMSAEKMATEEDVIEEESKNEETSIKEDANKREVGTEDISVEEDVDGKETDGEEADRGEADSEEIPSEKHFYGQEVESEEEFSEQCVDEESLGSEKMSTEEAVDREETDSQELSAKTDSDGDEAEETSSEEDSERESVGSEEISNEEDVEEQDISCQEASSDEERSEGDRNMLSRQNTGGGSDAASADFSGSQERVSDEENVEDEGSVTSESSWVTEEDSQNEASTDVEDDRGSEENPGHRTEHAQMEEEVVREKNEGANVFRSKGGKVIRVRLPRRGYT